MNNRANLSARKIVVMILIVIVIAFLFPSSLKLKDLVGSGISSFEEGACESEGFQNQNIIYCGGDTSCDKEDKKKWEEYYKYLDGKTCGDSIYIGKEKGVEKDKACTCMQKAIEYVVPDSGVSDEKLDKLANQGKNQDFTSIESKKCKTQAQNFDASNIRGTPYWVTSVGESGSDSLLPKIGQVVKDTKGTVSYGNFGLNSKGGAISFWNQFGRGLGLEGTPGTTQADESWKKVAQEKPNELAIAQIQWYNQYIIDPTIAKMKLSDFKEKFYNDPKVVAYLSDVTIQEGAALRNSLLIAVEPAFIENAKSYLKRLSEYQSSDEYLKKRFRKYLSDHPDRLEGFRNRILKVRYPLSKEVTILKIEGNQRVVCS